MPMNNDMSSYFEDPEFKDILAKYEGMAESHTPTYFDAEELTDIAEYYASQNEEQKAIYKEYIKDIREAIEYKLDARVELVDKLKKKKQGNE